MLPERNATSEFPYIIRKNLDIHLDEHQIGSPQIIAFSDFSRKIFLERIYNEIKTTPVNRKNRYQHQQDLNEIKNRIAFVEERIIDRRAGLNGYNKSYNEAKHFLDDLLESISIQTYRQRQDVYNEAVSDFCQIVDGRLSRG